MNLSEWVMRTQIIWILDVVSHDLTYQPLGLEDEFCDMEAVQDSLPEHMVSCSLSINIQSIRTCGQFCQIS